MLRGAQTTIAPMPTTTFQVTKTLLLPVASGVLVTGQAGIVGHQRPRFVVAHAPQRPCRRGNPSAPLENLPRLLPYLTRLDLSGISPPPPDTRQASNQSLCRLTLRPCSPHQCPLSRFPAGRVSSPLVLRRDSLSGGCASGKHRPSHPNPTIITPIRSWTFVSSTNTVSGFSPTH